MSKSNLPPRLKTLYNYAIFRTQGASTPGAIRNTSSKLVATPPVIDYDDDELYDASPLLNILVNPSESMSQLVVPTLEASILTLVLSLAS